MHRREDLYAGPELDKIPDLVVEFRDYAWLGKGNLTERTPTLEDAISIRAHPTSATPAATGPTGSSSSPGLPHEPAPSSPAPRSPTSRRP